MEKQFTLKDYQIGEFAKRMGVSSHFLKYYEETGILQPMKPAIVFIICGTPASSWNANG